MKILNLALVLLSVSAFNQFPAFASDDGAVDLSGGWYNSRDAKVDASTLSLGPHAFIHKTVTSQIDKSKIYHLEGTVDLKGSGSGLLGMAFYGPNKQRVGYVTRPTGRTKSFNGYHYPANFYLGHDICFHGR